MPTPLACSLMNSATDASSVSVWLRAQELGSRLVLDTRVRIFHGDTGLRSVAGLTVRCLDRIFENRKSSHALSSHLRQARARPRVGLAFLKQ
jgi:hypothetical protein